MSSFFAALVLFFTAITNISDSLRMADYDLMLLMPE